MNPTRLGAVCWVLCLQYFAGEAISVAGWRGVYSLRENYISDLGALGCSDSICSPLHALMNTSFVLQGMLISTGAALVWRAVARGWFGALGLGLVMASGLGVFLVGLAPENSLPGLHLIGAAEHFVFCNLGAALLGVSLLRWAPTAGLVSVAAGLVGLAAFTCLATHEYFGFGVGVIERVTAYPFPLWLAGMGAWLLAR
jgi:hypothetical membrane protein